MHVCGAAVRSRVHGNSRGTRVRGVEQGVRLFSLFPRFHSVLRARLTIEAPFFLFIVFFPYFSFLPERLRSVVRAWTCLSPTNQSFGKEQQAWQAQQQHPSKHHKRKDYY